MPIGKSNLSSIRHTQVQGWGAAVPNSKLRSLGRWAFFQVPHPDLHCWSPERKYTKLRHPQNMKETHEHAEEIQTNTVVFASQIHKEREGGSINTDTQLCRGLRKPSTAHHPGRALLQSYTHRNKPTIRYRWDQEAGGGDWRLPWMKWFMKESTYVHIQKG